MGWTWGVAFFSIVGTIANIKKQRWCFLVWLGTNGAWLIYSLVTQQYSRAVLDLIYLGLAVYGLVEWGRNRKGAVR